MGARQCAAPGGVDGARVIGSEALQRCLPLAPEAHLILRGGSGPAPFIFANLRQNLKMGRYVLSTGGIRILRRALHEPFVVGLAVLRAPVFRSVDAAGTVTARTQPASRRWDEILSWQRRLASLRFGPGLQDDDRGLS